MLHVEDLFPAPAHSIQIIQFQEQAAATNDDLEEQPCRDLQPPDAELAPLPPVPEAEPVAASVEAPVVDEAPAMEAPRADAAAPVVEAPAIEPEQPEEYPDDMPLQELADRVRRPVQPEEDESIAEPGPAAPAAPRGPAGPRVHRSPAEILELLAPPGIFIRLSFNDHRFKAETASSLHSDLTLLPGHYSQKAFSRCFASGNLSWQDALKQVHDYAWKKYDLFRQHGKSTAVDAPQEPGVVAAEILTQLEPEIQGMPPPTKYGRVVK